MPARRMRNGGNNGRFRWLGDLPLRCPDAVLFLARQDTTIVPEKSPPSERETRLRRPRRVGGDRGGGRRRGRIPERRRDYLRKSKETKD